MLYLTVDTCIWLNLLNDSWKEYIPLDHLEYWVGEGHLELLLPEIIYTEWENNLDKKRLECEKKIKEFFEMAEDIIPSAFISDQKKPDNIARIVDQQVARVKLLMTEKARRITFSPESNDKLIKWGLEKKAPMHKKSSVADGIIILSLFDFAAENPGHEYIFLTDNTSDFYEKSNNEQFLHSDLQPSFLKLGIKDYRNLNFAVQELKNRLPVTIDLNARKKERLKSKIAEKVFNPAVMEILAGVKDVYLENTDQINKILEKAQPSKQEMLFVLGLLDTDVAYQQYFYRRVTSPAWFPVLKAQGVFEPGDNPAPIAVKNGFQIPYWEPLTYLEALAKEIPNGFNQALSDELKGIVLSFSRLPVDNFRTWTSLLKILRYLPNECITLELIGFIPTWLAGSFRTSLETHEICEFLLPKFLHDSPGYEDVAKANLILKLLIGIGRPDKPDRHGRKKYIALADVHQLSVSLNLAANLTKIARFLGDEYPLYLAAQIKKLILDYPLGAKSGFRDADIAYTVNYLFLDEDLQVSIWKAEQPETKHIQIITDFQSISTSDLLSAITTIIKVKSPGYVPDDSREDPLKIMSFLINYDPTAGSGSTPISKLDGRYYGEEVMEVFTYSFRNILNEIAKTDLERTVTLLRTFCFDGHFKNPFYIRVALFVIGTNWLFLKNFFWKELDILLPSLLSDSPYRKDFYNMLFSIQHELSDNEKQILEEKINSLVDEDEDGRRDPAYLQLNWYAALRGIEPFKAKYEKVSVQLGQTFEHFEKLGNISISSGSISPIAAEQLLEMEHNEIAAYIATFKPSKWHDQVSVEGLSGAFQKAIELNPTDFVENLPGYANLYYIYTYHLFIGLENAWKAKRMFDWEKVMDFATNYISDTRFQNNAFQFDNDLWHADSSWVVGSLANLLAAGMHDDSNAMSTELLPKVKSLLTKITEGLTKVDDFEQRNMDYPMYLVNSTAGKTLRALFDYALFRSRHLPGGMKKGAIESDVKQLFDQVRDRRFIEAYIMDGMYYQQFLYLDHQWMKNIVSANLDVDDLFWRAFIGGLAFSQPPYNEELYILFYPHYIKAMQLGLPLSDNFNNGFINHFLSFYFWGLEDLTAGGLLFGLITGKNLAYSKDLVKHFWGLEAYIKESNEDEKVSFRKKVKALWQMLTIRFGSVTATEELEILAGLLHLLGCFDELDEEITGLILKSLPAFSTLDYTEELLEDLDRIESATGLKENAAELALILNNISFENYLFDAQFAHINKLVIILYENGLKTEANDFCDRLTRKGYEFLRELYKKYNP